MYGNNFFNPYMYQPYYQASNLTRGLGGLANTASRSGNYAGIGSALSGAGKAGTLGSFGKGLLGKFSLSGLLNGASKTLNVVNQAIPIYYQIKPVINNAKTMFRIMGAVKDDGNNKGRTTRQSVTNITNPNPVKSAIYSNGDNISSKVTVNSFEENNPTFFI